jgi:hypothetical protein
MHSLRRKESLREAKPLFYFLPLPLLKGKGARVMGLRILTRMPPKVIVYYANDNHLQ